MVVCLLSQTKSFYSYKYLDYPEQPIHTSTSTQNFFLKMAEFNPHELETITSNFGEIVEVPVYVPRYSTYHTSIVATGKQGSAPGELYSPSGVAIHEDTHQIFIVDSINHRVEIFSETGEFLNQLDVEWQSIIFGIATHGDSVYVSCWGDHTVRKFSLTEMCLVWRIGGYGSDDGQFNFPCQQTTDHNGIHYR